MCPKMLTTLSLLCVFLAWGVSPVQATPIALIDGEGDDSGWTVTSDGAALDLESSNIIDVDLTAKTVTITVAKDFGPYEEFLGDIIFPVGTLTFTEVNANAGKIDKIIIQSETIVNNTGAAWDTFSWSILLAGTDTEQAKFNITESSDWKEPSFSSWSFETDQVLASAGSVGNGVTFLPKSNLVIDIDLETSDDPIVFSVKQHASPEPVTAAILFISGFTVLGRRFRKR